MSIKFHIFELEYLWSQLANLDQILCVASLGWRKGCIRFWGRLNQNSGIHGNRKPPLTYNGENDVSSFLCPATRKWRGIMLYPPKFSVSVRPSVWLSDRPSVRPSVSAHHHSCIGNSSYSFRPILLKLYRCFKDGLKICILFFQNPEIIFYHFFPIFNLDIFRALILQTCIWNMYLVSATPPTVFGKSFWNFTVVLRMVWRYAYCFFRILKLFFITFFAFLT